MVELYKALGEYGVVMSMTADNELQLVHIQFEKGLTRRVCVYTYDAVCDPIRWQDMLIDHLNEFMFVYEQECIKYNRAMKLIGIWKKEK